MLPLPPEQRPAASLDHLLSRLDAFARRRKIDYSASNCPQSTPLFFNVEINLRCGAVFDDLLAVQFHF
jgi:hypothetical protein